MTERDALVLSVIHLVPIWAAGFLRANGWALCFYSPDEAASDAALGVLSAAESDVPARRHGKHFAVYARRVALTFMKDGLRQSTHVVSRARGSKYEEAVRGEISLSTFSTRGPGYNAVPGEVGELSRGRRSRRRPGEGAESVEIADPDATPPDELADRNDMTARLALALACLDVRTREVLRRRADNEALESIGRSLGLKRSRVGQIEAQGIVRLRELMNARK